MTFPEPVEELAAELGFDVDELLDLMCRWKAVFRFLLAYCELRT